MRSITHDKPIETGEELVRLRLDCNFPGAFNLAKDDYQLIAPAANVVNILQDMGLFGKVPLAQVEQIFYTRYPDRNNGDIDTAEKKLGIGRENKK